VKVTLGGVVFPSFEDGRDTLEFSLLGLLNTPTPLPGNMRRFLLDLVLLTNFQAQQCGLSDADRVRIARLLAEDEKEAATKSPRGTQ
jgi:hypothetical protein